MSQEQSSATHNVPWIVDAKGGPDETFQISVVRADNEQGIESYGKFGKDKIFISGSGGPCQHRVNKALWDRLMRVAEETAADLNAIEVAAVEVTVKSVTVMENNINPHSGKRLTELAFSDLKVGMEVILPLGSAGKIVRLLLRQPREDDNTIAIEWENGKHSRDYHHNFREVKVK